MERLGRARLLYPGPTGLLALGGVSVFLAAGAAGAYVVGVVGLHRLNVRRLRRASGGFPPLAWVDWDALFAGLLPAPSGPGEAGGPAVHGGGPSPSLLTGTHGPGVLSRLGMLRAVAAGQPVEEGALAASGFSGGQARWLRTLSLLGARPDEALERLLAADVGSAAELYVRERLLLLHRTHSFNLELSVFSTKRRLTLGLQRFGEAPTLYFVRAMASALIGFNRAAIDDLARAVYFSRQAPFYLRAVAATPYIEEARPALAKQCRLALVPKVEVG